MSLLLQQAFPAGVFVPGKPFQPGVMQHSSFLTPFISYKEKEVSWIWFTEVVSANIKKVL